VVRQPGETGNKGQQMNPTEMIPAPKQALAVHETATSAVAAQAVAAVQARYQLAVARPRNPDQARVNLIAECKRPRFAETARYNKPIGKGIIGPSIRFIEAAMRCYGNLYANATVTYDDETKRVIHVECTDLESNVTHSQDITVTKTVERHHPKDATVISTRTNSYGKTVYTIAATDDDIAAKQGALVSKAVRTLAQRLLPGDLVDEAMDTVEATLNNQAAKDPAAERNRLVDAFVAIGVHPEDLVQFLGHPIDRIQPKDLIELRNIHTSIRSGEATWQDFLNNGEIIEPDQSQTSAVKATLQARRTQQEPPWDEIEKQAALTRNAIGKTKDEHGNGLHREEGRTDQEDAAKGQKRR
jgi:hypothetical protein